jgi:hypothetical protein
MFLNQSVVAILIFLACSLDVFAYDQSVNYSDIDFNLSQYVEFDDLSASKHNYQSRIGRYLKNEPSIVSIVPLTTIPKAVIAGQKVVVEYKVTNNTPYILHNNALIGLQKGLEQVLETNLSASDDAPVCQHNFSLKGHASCNMVLIINADDIKGSLVGGPKVCSVLSDYTNCVEPTLSHRLNVPLLREGDVYKQTIVIMRHGEKPKNKNGQLECRGLNRALALPKVLNGLFGKPDYIFAPNPAGPNRHFSYIRPLMTIEPTAIQYNLTVSTSTTYTDFKAIAGKLVSIVYRNSLTYVCWEHRKIVPVSKTIVSMLGGEPNIIPEWVDGDFDSLYIITIAWYKGVPSVSFKKGSENLNGQSRVCPQTTPYKPIKESSSSTKIYFIPIGAAPDITMQGQLTCHGLNRGLGLSAVFSKNGIYPDQFYAPAPSLTQYYADKSIPTKDYLAQLMVEPLVIYHEKPLYTLFGYNDYPNMSIFLNSSQLKNSVTAVFWDIGTMYDLIKQVFNGAGGNLEPMTIDPNTIYLLDLNNGSPKLTKIPEDLKISNICPYPI